LATGVVVVSTIAYLGVAARIRADLDASLVREVEAYTAAVAPRGATDPRSLEDASRAYLQARVEQSTGMSHVLLVQFADGRVLSNSTLKLELAADNASALATETAAPGFGELYYADTRYRTATAPVKAGDGTTIAVFQAATATTELQSISAQLLISLGVAGVAVMLLGTALSFWVARQTLAPLREIARTASHISHARLGERIGHEGPDDEIHALAVTLDNMLDRLEEAFAEQRRFVADASHELRTPVAVIRGNLELVDSSWGDAEGRREALKVVRDEVERMQRLLDDMLSLARSTGVARRPFQPLDIGLLLRETAIRARSVGRREWDLSCAADVWVLGDPDLLAQAIGNLLRNAVDYTSVGDLIRLSCRQDRGDVAIVVHDAGSGIPPEDLPRVFDRFFRSGERRADGGEGNGLGLAIAQRLTEMHGGSITADNAPDGGAVFTLLLPAIDPPDDGL
jgi:signal transduction histidine kinase